jgi:hypothetical protein
MLELTVESWVYSESVCTRANYGFSIQLQPQIYDKAVYKI